MISFIIIGRNEGWRLSLSLLSVVHAVNSNNLKCFEIIYIDSNSTDDSVERAQYYDQVKIIKLTGEYNAAIARNIGVQESSGDVIFFIDGDMEINPNFLPLVYSNEAGLKYHFVSGQLKNYNYDEDDNFIDNSWQYNGVLKSDRHYSTTGGVFLIKRQLWNLVGGMDVRFKRGQDLELALRLAKKGYKIFRKKEIIANHHTISYKHQSRIWKTLFSGDISYSNSFLYRKHLFNKNVYKKIITTNYTLVFFVISQIAGFNLEVYAINFTYIFLILLRVIKNKQFAGTKIIEATLFYIVRDLLSLFYFFVPIPKIMNTDIHYTFLGDQSITPTNFGHYLGESQIRK